MSTVESSEFVAGNYFDKYRSGNPIHQWMMRGFLEAAHGLTQASDAKNILEVGCGPGDLASNLIRAQDVESQAISYLGTDISSEEIATARNNYPYFEFQEASIYELPFADGQFDFVIACEVLEHLDSPANAIDEIARVTSRYALISVPWEPMWRILNVARGKYVSSLGNTPGHLQNFSRRAIRSLLSRRFRILQERKPLPWSMFLVEILH